MIITKKSDRLIGLIPAAGRGTRMRPITNTLPKALIKIEGKSLLERAIEVLKAIGVEKIIVVTGYLEEKVREFLHKCDFGIKIELVVQKKQLGLAHTIAISSDYLTNDFLLFCPDNIYTNLNDIKEAMQLFIKSKPTVLQTTTVTPNQQENRSVYFSGSFRNIAPNLFDNNGGSLNSSGISMFPTGLTFFSKDLFKYIPSFLNSKGEQSFSSFLSEIMNKSSFMIYLLRGTRYDLTEPKDVDFYVHLQESLPKKKDEGVSAILINKKGKVLLHLRDNIPAIRYPGYWALFGGSIETDETPYEAIKREIKEEIKYELVNFGLFREYSYNNKREYAFVGEIDAGLSDLILGEGQAMKFFDLYEISTLNIRPDDRESITQYIKKILK